ncbi:hypothetical protein GCM10027217_06840 [Pseudomaricurvus hydrocarbonicus]
MNELYQRQGFRARRKYGNFSALNHKSPRNTPFKRKTGPKRRFTQWVQALISEIKVDRSDIAKLAELARIEIAETTVDEVAKSITDVLALVDQLQAADTDGIAPMAHPLDATQRLRADVVTETNRREEFQALAPAAEQGLFLVPKVID